MYESAKAGAIVTALIAKAAIAAIVFMYMGIRVHLRVEFGTRVLGNVAQLSHDLNQVLTQPLCEQFRTHVKAERPWKRLCSQVNPNAR